jgi:YVTN family beta-propeller protein
MNQTLFKFGTTRRSKSSIVALCFVLSITLLSSPFVASFILKTASAQTSIAIPKITATAAQPAVSAPSASVTVTPPPSINQTITLVQQAIQTLQSGYVNDTMLRLTQADQQLSQMQNMTSTQSAKVLVEDSIGLLKQRDANAALSRITLAYQRLVSSSRELEKPTFSSSIPTSATRSDQSATGINQLLPVSVHVGDSPADLAANPATGMVYVANCGSDTVSVINDSLDKIVTTIRVGSEPCGIAVDPNTNMVYVANSASNSVAIIDGLTNNVVKNIPVGNNPIAVAIDPGLRQIYVANRGSNTLSVIDGATEKVVSNIKVGISPLGVAVNPNTNTVYVANRDSSNISVINGLSNVVIKTVSVGIAPSKIAVNPITNKVYVTLGASGSETSVIDGKTNNVIKIFTSPGFSTGL